MGPVSDDVEIRRWRFYTTGDAIVLVPFSYSVNAKPASSSTFSPNLTKTIR
jgi:hypothetical protein